MLPFQPGILAALPPAARHLTFRLAAESEPGAALAQLASALDGQGAVLGIGSSTLGALGKSVPGLHEPTALVGHGVAVPATPLALWVWLRGSDRGELLHRGRQVVKTLSGAFVLESVSDAFFHDTGRDLSGYEDGTENPEGDEAIAAAFVADGAAGLAGSSFVAVQLWKHDLAHLETFSEEQRDHVIGRRRSDNEELEDAPPSAHVKRTAQESFDPEAFVLRRSMPWTDGLTEGLVFVAFGRSFDAFEAQLRRMVGLDDGITDALFRFTRPLTTSYFWCPPVRDGKLDLSLIGL
jgi:porphyrinogen peroxidase